MKVRSTPSVRNWLRMCLLCLQSGSQLLRNGGKREDTHLFLISFGAFFYGVLHLHRLTLQSQARCSFQLIHAETRHAAAIRNKVSAVLMFIAVSRL
ncbi:hypothetical protein [Methylocucumis oryzae]|uniref:hypothetical protein n=1 Tax=Methylocucumis oryzae TaxID=1632867 RepID=UPI00178CAD02|nr:hypothetical protein [Methylocucumis oryzae]